MFHFWLENKKYVISPLKYFIGKQRIVTGYVNNGCVYGAVEADNLEEAIAKLKVIIKEENKKENELLERYERQYHEWNKNAQTRRAECPLTNLVHALNGLRYMPLNKIEYPILVEVFRNPGKKEKKRELITIKKYNEELKVIIAQENSNN